jgi:hypothetical protein
MLMLVQQNSFTHLRVLLVLTDRGNYCGTTDHGKNLSEWVLHVYILPMLLLQVTTLIHSFLYFCLSWTSAIVSVLSIPYQLLYL